MLWPVLLLELDLVSEEDEEVFAALFWVDAAVELEDDEELLSLEESLESSSSSQSSPSSPEEESSPLLADASLLLEEEESLSDVFTAFDLAELAALLDELSSVLDGSSLELDEVVCSCLCLWCDGAGEADEVVVVLLLLDDEELEDVVVG